jgi:hypothetical protein
MVKRPEISIIELETSCQKSASVVVQIVYKECIQDRVVVMRETNKRDVTSTISVGQIGMACMYAETVPAFGSKFRESFESRVPCRSLSL